MKFTSRNINPTLLAVLEKHGLVDEFISETVNQNNVTDSIKSKIDPVTQLGASFVWETSSRGHKFWSKLECEL